MNTVLAFVNFLIYIFLGWYMAAVVKASDVHFFVLLFCLFAVSLIGFLQGWSEGKSK